VFGTFTGNLNGSSRGSGGTYTNSTGRPLGVYISGSNAPSNGRINVNIGGQTFYMNGYGSNPGCFWIVPTGATYSFTNAGASVQYWNEY
jgi:hypothetical protein